MPKPDLDPVALFTWIASLVLSQQVAEQLAPHALILVMSTFGALVALGRRDPLAKPNGVTFILVVNAIALSCTTLLASILAPKFPTVAEKAMFAPLALILGMIGLDYPTLIPKAWEYYKEWRAGGRNNNG